MRLRRLLPSTLAAVASLFIFATSAAAWPDECAEGETWVDEEDGSTCSATGSTVEHAGIEFCAAECGSGFKLFSLL